MSVGVDLSKAGHGEMGESNDRDHERLDALGAVRSP